MSLASDIKRSETVRTSCANLDKIKEQALFKERERTEKKKKKKERYVSCLFCLKRTDGE